MRDRIFYTICFGFLSGIFLRSFIFLNLYFVILFGIIACALFLIFLATPKRSEGGSVSQNNWGILVSIFVLAFCFGIFRFHLADKPAPEVFEKQVGQTATFSGEIVDEPDIRPKDQQLTVEVFARTVLGENSLRTVLAKTKIIISADLDQDFKYGDEINFTGKLKKPENFLTDQGKTFDYVNYLRKDGIFYLMTYPQVQIVSRGNGSVIKSALFTIKRKFLNEINFLIPNPESIFAGGLMLGEKSDFDQTLKQSFVDTGMIHLVTLSGYKVTMIASWFMKVFSFLPRSFGIGIGILAIWLFVLMTGGAASAIRAGIMATLALFARATGRNYDVARALILTAVLMILLNPFVLVFDVSFQLSFLGTIAIIFMVPRIEKYFSWITERFGLRDIVTITCAIYIFVFPFILYEMGNFSLVALPANILIMPLFPLTIMFGFLAGLIGLVWSPLSMPFAYISYFLMHYELWIINIFSHMPFATFTIPNFPLFLIILIYAYFTYFLFGGSIKSFFLALP
jgi:competence protein ComEC